MIGGLVSPSIEGTPQGGPLSPRISNQMSNIVLDELDKELEKRGLRFVRYADDFVIYVRSRKAAQRVLQSVTRFIERRLKLKVNLEKSAVSRLIVFPGGGGHTWGSALPVVGITHKV